MKYTDHLIIWVKLLVEPTDAVIERIIAPLYERWPNSVTGHVWEMLEDNQAQIMLFGKFRLDEG